MHAKLIENAANLRPETMANGDWFGHERRRFATGLPQRGLGCSQYVVPPGRCAFPAHAHLGNDEALYVLTGEGSLRSGNEQHALGPGDFAHLPAGSPAHQVINTGTADLVYLCFSTMAHPDVIEYPDSRKAGLFSGSAPGGDAGTRNVMGFFPIAKVAGYFDGE